MIRNGISDIVAAPSITGATAVGWTIAAIAVPTAIRAAVDSFVSGCELTIYLPFVMLVAIFMGWKHAAAAAVGSIVAAQLLFMCLGHQFSVGSCDTYSIGVLLIGSIAIIGFVEVFRGIIARRSGSSSGIVFSLRDGKAWASWYGHPTPVQLCSEEEVAEMMEDFLKQIELGKRLNRPKE